MSKTKSVLTEMKANYTGIPIFGFRLASPRNSWERTEKLLDVVMAYADVHPGVLIGVYPTFADVMNHWNKKEPVLMLRAEFSERVETRLLEEGYLIQKRGLDGFFFSRESRGQIHTTPL